MKIKNFTLLTASCLSAIAGVFLLNDSSKEQYFPRSTNSFETKKEIHQGYLEYMQSIRNNRTTGEISVAEVNAAKKQASKLRKGNKSLGLSWNFKGPDNVGGRTRAFVIDNQDTTHLYAGAVSGGIWHSYDEGLSWTPIDDGFEIQNVSAMSQASNGDVYVATGPFHDGSANAKSVGSEFVGNGIWKLVHDPVNRTVSRSLIVGPTTDFNYGAEWASTAEIAVDPNDDNRIFVATSRGLRETTDGGLNWSNPLGLNAACHDVHITADGKIIAAFATFVRVSSDNGATYTNHSFGNGFRSRVEVAIAPTNTNIMYAAYTNVNVCTEGVYKSIDAGLTWQKLLNTPNYMANSIACQGFYDNTISVYPTDPNKIIVGGIGLFQWTQSSVDPAPIQGEWKVIASTVEFNGAGSRNPFYVHADVHYFKFHPTNPNKLFIGSDGGVGFSNNMLSPFPTYSQYNFGYNVTQFYDIGINSKGLVIGGTQDNGTQLVGLGFNTGQSAVQVRGGDGFDVDLFSINTELGIASLYFGDITRVQGIGTSLSSSTFNNASIYSGVLASLANDPNYPTGASEVFYTTTAKWESFNHPATKDSVIIRDTKTELPPLAANTVINYESKNNRMPLKDSTTSVTFPKDTSTILPTTAADTFSLAIDSSIKVRTFINAFDTITVDENNMTVEIRYRGKDPDTMTFTYGVPVNYNNLFHNDLSRRAIAPAPLSVTVERDLDRNQSEIIYVDPQVRFNYELEFPDLVQSTVAIFNIRGTLPSQTNQRHVYISKDLQKGSEVTEPRWIKVAGNISAAAGNPRGSIATPNSNNTISAVFSNDGDKLFYGTTGGDLYRIDSLNEIDLSQLDISLPADFVMENITAHRKIFDFGNRSVTGIAIDPNNDDNVVVTLGNYGSAQYVQRSTNATAIGGVQFTQISGAGANKLPNSPVYEAVIDFRDHNKVIIGTELGVFATDNAFTTATATDNGQTVLDVQWTEENIGLGRAPVMAVKQQTFGWADGATNQGKVYIGTHGRGIFESDQLVSIAKNDSEITTKVGKNSLTVYPNPTVEQVNIELDAPFNANASVQVFNLNGQLVKEVQPTNLSNGTNTVNVNVQELDRGTYIVRSIVNGVTSTGKFIKQ